MDDLINRQTFMKAMYHRAFETDGDTMWQSGCWVRYRAVEQVAKGQPSVDAVEVVRCKNCKWYDPSDELCLREGMVMDAEDFCSRGEQNDD